MTPDVFLRIAVVPALSLLPSRMDSPAARVMLVAIALQESGLRHRLQIGGPARGFLQFERGGGVAGVLSHTDTAQHAAAVCAALQYPASAPVVYQAIADNDVLACAFARLLLWTLPDQMATTAGDGWMQYINAWRPGKPHPATWAAYYQTAAATVFVA